MARPKRINLPYCLFHVFSRSNSGDTIFRNTADREKFMHYLARMIDIFSFRLHAYCLMDNHFHLLLESGERSDLSELMRRLLTAYTFYFNRRHRRRGHLFQGRFGSLVVDKTSQMLALSRYIHLNPAKTEHALDPETFEGSSLRFYIKGGEPPCLHTAEILSWFDGRREKYAIFVREGLNEETKPAIVRQRYVGDAAFVRRMEKRLGYIRETGNLVMQSEKRRATLMYEAEVKHAEEWTRRVSEYFGVKPEMIRKGRYPRKAWRKARGILIYILSETMPWSHAQIGEYMNLAEKNGISYHIRRVSSDMECLRVAKEILMR